MKTPRQKEFLDVASSIVAREGFSRLTIRNVVSAIGVTEPAFYRHFSSKFDLLKGMLEELQAAIIPHFQKIRFDADDTKGQIEHFIRGIFQELKTQPSLAPFIFSEELFNTEPQMKPIVANLIKTNLSILSESFQTLQYREIIRKDIAAEDMAAVTMGSIRLAVSRWHLNDGTFRLKDLEDNLVNTLTILFAPPEQD